jgi:hypothetical protein
MTCQFSKGVHRYYVRYDESTKDLARVHVRCWAASKKLNLSWYDAAIICSCITRDEIGEDDPDTI